MNSRPKSALILHGAWLPLAHALLLSACSGGVDTPVESELTASPTASGQGQGPGQSATGQTSSLPGSSGSPVGSQSGMPSVPGSTSGGPVDPVPPPGQDAVAATSRALRLSYSQFDRVASDLLGIPVDVSKQFPEEGPTLNGYFEEAALTVTDRLKTQLTSVAETLAASVVQSASAYQTLVGCTSADATCRDSFIDSFIGRAYRRPATQSERTAYQSLFDGAGALIQSGDAFKDGVQLVVEAALQSPNFLYRIDQGSAETDEFGVRVTPYELASRLSFLFLGSMPDPALRAAAEDGSLATADGFERELQRLGNDPRVAERSLDFHERWLQLASLEAASKDATAYPMFSPALVSSMQQEFRSFVRDVTVDNSGGVIELLTAPYGYVNASLNSVYKLDGNFGDEPMRVAYPSDSPRAGLLTQAAFLSGHSSSSTSTSPILRGTFVLRRIACYQVPDPPPNASSKSPPAPAQAPVTTRDMFTWKTSLEECSTCHSVINPAGFAFEGFDGVGQHRTQENGAPIDSTGSLVVPAALTFTDAKDLSTQLAALPQVAKCYATHWLQYAYGRPVANADALTIADLSASLGAPGFGAKQTLSRLARSAAFSHINAP